MHTRSYTLSTCMYTDIINARTHARTHTRENNIQYKRPGIARTVVLAPRSREAPAQTPTFALLWKPERHTLENKANC